MSKRLPSYHCIQRKNKKPLMSNLDSGDVLGAVSLAKKCAPVILAEIIPLRRLPPHRGNNSSFFFVILPLWTRCTSPPWRDLSSPLITTGTTMISSNSGSSNLQEMPGGKRTPKLTKHFTGLVLSSFSWILAKDLR